MCWIVCHLVLVTLARTSAFRTTIVFRQSFQQRFASPSAEANLGTNTKAGKKFDEMLDDFRQHTAADINLVVSPRFRGLLHGTSAAINDKPITSAFKILYEDLGPVRVAGDLIFSKLEREVQLSKVSDAAKRVRELQRGDSCIVAARKVFDAVDTDRSGTVSSKELLSSDLLRSLGQCADCSCEKKGSCQSVSKFMEEVDQTCLEGELHFDDFLVASHHLLYEANGDLALFGGEEADDMIDQLLSGAECDVDKGKADKYAKRFDSMCEEFNSWDGGESSSKAEARNPRLAMVLAGCFAGAKQPAVVNALKILYMDFFALRMAGDLIFKMMRKLAN